MSATNLDRAAGHLDTAMREVKRLYKAERVAELEGRRVRRFDPSGMHPVSVAVGRVLAIRELYPELTDTEWDPRDVEFAAVVEAHREFADRLVLNGWEETFVRGMRT